MRSREYVIVSTLKISRRKVIINNKGSLANIAFSERITAIHLGSYISIRQIPSNISSIHRRIVTATAIVYIYIYTTLYVRQEFITYIIINIIIGYYQTRNATKLRVLQSWEPTYSGRNVNQVARVPRKGLHPEYQP